MFYPHPMFLPCAMHLVVHLAETNVIQLFPLVIYESALWPHGPVNPGPFGNSPMGWLLALQTGLGWRGLSATSALAFGADS